MRSAAHSVPITQLRQQLPNILAMAGGGLRSVLRRGRPAPGASLEQQIKAPSPALLAAYQRWAGVDAARFGDAIPPHFAVGQMALAMIARLTAQCPYPLLSVVNQGVHLRINQPLPRTEGLRLTGRLVDASDDGYRARIHSRLSLAAPGAAEPALVIDAFAAVMLRPRPNKQTAQAATAVRWRTAGHWQAAADEGVTFFLLTGDFNPIHTLPLIARRTRFKGCIMHGYGSFAQLFESVRNAGWDIADIDVRFVRPVPLPSPALEIQVSEAPEADGRRAVRMVDGEGQVYQAGSFLPAEAAA